jgi:hypothetical protein
MKTIVRDLTSMQAASWVGRSSGDRLGGVSAHLYAEFDGHDLDPDRLRAAVRALCRRHPMLTLRLDAEGRQRLDPDAEPLPLEVEDLRGQRAEARHAHLVAKRRAWTHRTLDLTRGRAAVFGLSLLPGSACRLHVDTDMIAVDPNSFRIAMEDLAGLYEDPRSSGDDAGAPGFFDWLDGMSADDDAARRRERDRTWWRSRLRDIAPAPPLPPPPTDAEQGTHSDRLATWLSPVERRALETCARRHRITASGLLLGLFAAVLGPAMGAERFRLNVPTFWREPVVPGVGRIVGEFSNVLILSVDLAAAETLGGLCRTIGASLTELLGHAAYPGVSVMRDLSRHHGGLQTAPVVFTAGLGRAGDLFTERVGRVLGRMNWVISQGPQVALDAQVAAFEGGLLINFDVRLDALPEPWIRGVLDAYAGLLRAVADQPAALDRPLRPETVRPSAAAPSATEAMLIALLRRLAPGEPAGGEIPVACAARAGLRAFIAAYLPDGGLADDAVGSEATPRHLAALIRAGSGGRSDAVARIFLETFDEG